MAVPQSAQSAQGANTASPIPISPAPIPIHKNKLTQCFDDIMRVAAEMMVQQQLRTIQLDSSVVNGFSQAQQKVLSEKVHMFHAILDDLETTLKKSKSYVESIHEIGIEKEKQKEKEREAFRRKQEEEEEAERKNKEQQELERQQMEKKAEEERQQRQTQTDSKVEFPVDTTNRLLGDFADGDRNTGDSPVARINLNQVQSEAAMSPDDQRQPQSMQQQSPNQDKALQQPRRNDLGELGNLDISMFPGLENSDFDMGNFSTGINGAANNGSSNTNIEATANPQRFTERNIESGSLEASGNPMGDNGEDYLTLNDFNDLNIDWSTNGDPGDLDLNGFNI